MALTDLARNLQQFMRDFFTLAKNQLKFIVDKLKIPAEDHYLQLVPIVKTKIEDFSNKVINLKGDYLEKFLEVQVFCKLEKYKKIQGEALMKMKNYLQKEFKSFLDQYSGWIAKYQNVLDEYYDDTNEILSLMQACKDCIEYCKDFVKELTEIFDQSSIKDHEKTLFFEVQNIAYHYFNCRDAVKTHLRYERLDVEKCLKQYGYTVEYTDSEVCLGFGEDPELDVFKHDDIYYLRKDMTQSQSSKHIMLEALTFLKDLPDSDWK